MIEEGKEPLVDEAKLSNLNKTIGELVQVTFTMESGDRFLVHVGHEGISYLFETIKELLNRIESFDSDIFEDNEEFARSKFKEVADKLFDGCSEFEGCFLHMPAAANQVIEDIKSE